MIGADTNLLVRFIIGDLEEHSEKVTELLNQGEVLYINETVLTELTWVLISLYDFKKTELIQVLDTLLESEGFRFFNQEVITKAITKFVDSTVGFNDCLICEINRAIGLNTLTFDKKASKLIGMSLLE